MSDFFAAALPTVLAYLLGLFSSGRLASRAERLYDLAAKMPEGSDVRKSYEDAAEKAAVKTILWTTTPRSVRWSVAYLAFLLFWLWLNRALPPLMPGTAKWLGTMAGHMQAAGWGPTAAVVIAAVLLVMLLLGIVAGSTLLIYAANNVVVWLIAQRGHLRSRWTNLPRPRSYRLRVIGALALLAFVACAFIFGLVVSFA